MSESTGIPIDRFVIYTALFIVIAIGVRMMSYIVTILIVSIILTLMALPAMDYFRKKGFSDLASAVLLATAACICLIILVILVLFSIRIFMDGLPLYEEQLTMRLAGITEFLGGNSALVDSITRGGYDIAAIVQTALSALYGIGEALMYIFFIGVATFFMLLEAPHLPERIRKVVGQEPEKILEISRMSRFIINFVIVRAETNLVHGILFGGALLVMGVHAAVVWGFLTFLLGFIPFIGLIIAAIPAIIFAYIQFGLPGAIAVVAIVCILNLIVENPVFSYLASRRFEIPPLVVLLSVIIWGWLLGLVGMLFSVPITLMVLVLFQCSDDLKKINILLGTEHLFEEDDAGVQTGDTAEGSTGGA
jgi:predicted PurR-regulated permease PerM